MSNNTLIFNAAYNAFVGGTEFERVISSATPSNYVGITNAAAAFATEVDLAIPFDAAMNSSKAALLQQICASQVEGRVFTSAVAGSYAARATAIAALYTEAAPALLAPPVTGAPPTANFFALMPGDNAATVAVGAPVLFPQNGPTVGAAATRASSSTFTLPATGTYRISCQVSVTEAGQLQVALGGVGLPNTVAGRATGTSEIVIDTLITATAGQVLSIINPAGNAAALTITPIAGGTHSVSATLNIQQLA